MRGSSHTADTLDVVVQALNAKRYTSGWWACCPSHDDSRPSLVFWIGRNRVLRFACKSGCDERSVREEIAKLADVDLDAPTTLRVCKFEYRRQPPPIESLQALEQFAYLPPARSHPYLAAKGIAPVGEDVRVDGDALVLPMRNAHGELANLQRIVERRGGLLAGNRRAPSKFEKFFLRGLSPRGLLLPLGDDTPDSVHRIHVVEGFATGVSVYSAVRACVLVAFTADNLLPVALLARQLHPHAELIICGDNDAPT